MANDFQNYQSTLKVFEHLDPFRICLVINAIHVNTFIVNYWHFLIVNR